MWVSLLSKLNEVENLLFVIMTSLNIFWETTNFVKNYQKKLREMFEVGGKSTKSCIQTFQIRERRLYYTTQKENFRGPG